MAAQALGVPLSSVFIAETATDKVANASPTAASASSDLYGSAVTVACKEINGRLQRFREANPEASFKEVSAEGLRIYRFWVGGFRGFQGYRDFQVFRVAFVGLVMRCLEVKFCVCDFVVCVTSTPYFSPTYVPYADANIYWHQSKALSTGRGGQSSETVLPPLCLLIPLCFLA